MLVASCSSVRSIIPDIGKVGDTREWSVFNGETVASVEAIGNVVRLAPIGGDQPGSNIALALAGDAEFSEGTIDVDLKGKGRVDRSFLGVAFNVVDAKMFEAVYFRPFNFQPEDPMHRTHAVQYIAWPEHTWEELRANTPSTYEAAIHPMPDPANWFHARIEVSVQTVRVFVQDGTEPCLVIKRLRAPQTKRIGLFVDSHEGWFANLKITPKN